MSTGRISIGIKIGDTFYENMVEVQIGIDGFETNERISAGLEELARQIRKQTAALKTPEKATP